MQSKLEKIFNKSIEYGFYALFFLTPLLFNPSRNYPSFELFEWNKMFFVYVMTLIISSAWIGKMILYRKIIFKRTAFDLPILFFLISQSLSTLFSIDQHVSIFGYYSRFHGGLLSTFCYIILYYALVTNQTLINFKKLLMFILSSGLVITMYGILEKFGIDKNMWVQDVQARVFSTLGQPNWLAAYLTILLPLAIGLLIFNFPVCAGRQFLIFNFKNVLNRKKTLYSLPAQAGSFIILYSLLLYSCLLFTKSRSGFLGFWGANLIFWGFIFFKNWSNKQNFFKLFIILHSLFFILNFTITTPFPQYNRIATYELFQKKSTSEVTTAPIGDTVLNIGITDSGDIRKIVWQGAIDIAKTYPLFGTGPETFAFSYYKFRPQAHNMTSEWDFLYNKAHNEYLNFAATSGFLGLATYLLLIIWVIIYAIKKQFSIINHHSLIIILSLLTAYISILITNFFGFSVAIVGLYFFLIPSVIFIYGNNHVQSSVTINLQKFSKIQKILLILLCLSVLYLIVLLSKFWIADSFYARALSLSRQENYTDAYKYVFTATSLRDNEPVYHDEKASVASNLALMAYQGENATLSARLSLEAVNESTKALKISPQNVNFWKTRTRIFFMLSEINPQFTQSALDAIKITQDLAPTDAKIAYNVAVISGRADKKPEAITALLKAIDLKPDYRDAYIALSLFYEEAGQKAKAKETLEMVLKKINPDDQEVKTRIEKL